MALDFSSYGSRIDDKEDELDFSSAGELVDLSSSGTPVDVTDTGDETARLAARYKAPEKPGLIERAASAISSVLPKPVDPMGIASGKPLGSTPIRAEEPAKQAKAPTPYRDRREALDDAVNLLEEGADQGAVTEAFGKAGIKFDEIVAHGQKRGSEYFKQQTVPQVDTEVARLAARYPAPQTTDEIKPYETSVGEDIANFAKRVSGRSSQAFTGLLANTGVINEDQAAAALARDERRIQAARAPESIQAGFEEIGQAKTYGEAVTALARNPGATATMLAESVLMTAPVLAASAARLPAVGLAAATGGFSASLEYGGAMADVLSERRIDMLDANKLAAALKDPEIIAEIRDKGTKRGLTIGIIDGLTAGIAGKFLEPVQKTIAAGKLASDAARRATVGAWAKELGVQVAGGSGGEFAAQQLTGENKPADVLLEGLGEGVSAPFEARSNLAASRKLDPLQQIAQEIEGTNIDVAGGVDGRVRTLLNPNAYDSTLISPEQTTRQAGDVGPSAPVQTQDASAPADPQRTRLIELETVARGGTSYTYPTAGGESVTVEIPEGRSLSEQERTELGDLRMGRSQPISFTPADSPTARAGLAPIVVPVPSGAPITQEQKTELPPVNPEIEQQFGLDTLRMGTTNVGTTGGTGAAPAVGGVAGSDQRSGGVDLPGLDAAGTGQLSGGDAGLPATNAGADVPARGAGGQPTASLSAENNNAVGQPIEQWVGRKGGGYETEADAKQALPGRQRMFPALDWTVEQMPGGKFRLAGYEQQSSQPAPTVGATEAGAGVTQPTQAAPITSETASSAQAAPAQGPAITSETGAPITAPSGKPFSTEKTAAVYAQQNGITGYSTVKMDGGWVIKPTETTLGTQAPQAFQATQEGQQAPAVGGSANTASSIRQPQAGVLRNAPTGGSVESQQIRDTYQAELDAVKEPIKLNAPTPEAEAQVEGFGNALGKVFGIDRPVVAFSDSTAPNGFAFKGQAFVNTADVEIGVQRTSLHEFTHLIEAIAEADTQSGKTGTAAQNFIKQIYSVFDDVSDDFKRVYVEKYLHAADLKDLKGDEREAAIQGYLKSQKLRSEITADFMGNRANDRAFLEDLAEKDPNGFESFVQKWISLIDNLMQKLRGAPAQERGPQAAVDRAVKDLAKAKMVARDALIAYRKGSMKERRQASSAGVTQGRVTQATAMAGNSQPMASNRAAPETPEFKKFFGNSKVVDAAGNPMVVYHGTNADVTAFDDTASGANSGNRGFLGRGFYFSSSPQSASMYAGVTRPQGTDTWRRTDGGNVMPVYLSLQNPLEISEKGLSKKAADALNSVPVTGLKFFEGDRGVDGDLALAVEQNPELSDAIRSALTALGYDGVIVDGGREIVAFRPEQIKSATGNNGQFNASNPDIRRSNRAVEGNTEDNSFENNNADVMPPEQINADGIMFSLRKVEEINDAPEITMQDLVDETVFPILADLTAAGYVYMGKELRGGPYYTLLPSNSKAGLIWANDGKGVASIKNKKAARGVIGLIVAMKQDSHATNNTVANIIFRAVEDEIQKGSVAKADIPKLDDIVRSLATRTATKTRKVDGKKVKETKQVFPKFADFPGFSDRAASEKFLRAMPFEARGLFFEEMTKPTVEDLGLGVIRKVINDTVEPDLRGLNMGDVVMAIRFDPNADTIELGEKTGTPEHDSYRYGVKGEVIGKFKRPISFENVFVDLMAERRAAGKDRPAGNYRSLTLRKPEQLITKEIAGGVGQEKYKTFKTPAEAKAAVAVAAMDWKVIDRPAAAGVKEFLRTARIYGEGKVPSFGEAKMLIKDGRLRIFRLANTESWFSIESRGNKRVMTHAMVAQPGVERDMLFGDMVFQARANGATHIEEGGKVEPITEQKAMRRVAPIVSELSEMPDADIKNLGIDPKEVDRLNGLIGEGEEEFSAEALPVYSNRVTDTPAFKRWFGDSKVVDTEGKPLIMYHGTAQDISTFRAKQAKAIFVTSDPDFAEGFAGMSEAWMLKNYEQVLTQEQIEAAFDEAESAIRQELRSAVVADVEVAKLRGGKPTGIAQEKLSAALSEQMPSGPNIIPVYVSAQNPFDFENPDHIEMLKEYERDNRYTPRSISFSIGSIETGYWEEIERPTIQAALKDLGFDGFYVKEDGKKNLAVYKPEQLKSAIGNNGEFDAANPDIRKSNRVQPTDWRDEAGRVRFMPGAVAYRYAADIANKLLDKTPLIGSLKPIDKDLALAMRRMKTEIENAQTRTAGVASKLGELPEDERKMISDVIEGELKRGVKPAKRVLEVAASMQSIMSEQSAELVRLGMLTSDAASRWDGKYLPRFYEQTLKNEASQWAKAAKALLGRKKTMQGIKGSNLKGRGIFETIPVDELEAWLAEGWEERDPNFDPATDTEITVWRDYTRAERENMGEIRDAMFRFVMGYMKSQRDVALGRLYENLADTVASKSEKEGYVQVPKTNIENTKAPRYGKLSGKWVPQEVLDHLSAFDGSMENELLKVYRKGLSMWKEGKTVLNPVAHANNVLSNLTMAHFAGVSYWDANKYLGAARDIVKGSPMLTEAREAGLFGGTVSQAELVSMLPDQLKVLAAKTESNVGKIVDTAWNAMSFFLRKPLGVAYEAEDLYFRYLIYRDARAKGMDPEDAVTYAQQYIFTYDDLPKGARTIRDAPIGIPFFSWTYKAIPMIARTALEYPWRMAAPAAAMYAANAAMYAIAAGADAGDDEPWWEALKRYVMDAEFREQAKQLEQQERKNLPEWQKGFSSIGTPKAIRLGNDDLTNLPLFLDVSRIFPGGDLGDFHNNLGGVPLPAWLTPNNPVLTSLTAFLQNKDSFTGKEIVSAKLDTGGEKSAKWGEYAWRQFAPAVAPFNYHFDRTMNAVANATGTTIDLGVKEYTGVDKMGQPVQPKYAAMQTFGIKVRPTDLEVSEQIEESQRKQLIRELDKQIRQIKRLENKGYYSEEKAEAITDPIREKRQRLKEGLTIDGEERE